jgi:regulator of cell morphogenesis and NO signaling
MEVTSTELTVGELVADNFKAAGIFQKHGIDFCCGGKQSLQAASAEKSVDIEALIQELQALTGEGTSAHRFNEWGLDFLIDYIVNTHHSYVSKSLPIITEYAQKVASVHGDNHPEAVEIFNTFLAIKSELEQHMYKEENILFPYIKQLVVAQTEGQKLGQSHFGTIMNPISMMEAEHESAGGAMAKINELSSGFTPPEDACTTFKVLYQELDAFERDLHQHIHLENNILHPKAIRMEQEVM